MLIRDVIRDDLCGVLFKSIRNSIMIRNDRPIYQKFQSVSITITNSFEMTILFVISPW